jgi:4'-phosphopantetheinyl transferase EntD
VILLQELLPQWVLVAEGDPRSANTSALFADEWASVTEAVEKRQREFAAGRLLARSLLRSFGYTGPLCRQLDGLPKWPPGIIGSISHCTSLAAVAICRTTECFGIGIDIEEYKPLPAEVASLTLTAEERRWSEGSPAAPLQVFCAKEAIYKAIYPYCHKFVEFEAVIVEPTNGFRGFTASLIDEVSPFRMGTNFEGRWLVSRGYVGASVLLGKLCTGAAASRI